MATDVRNSIENAAAGPPDIAQQVSALLARAGSLGHGEVKLALDALVDPALDIDAAAAELDRLAAGARLMAPAGAGPDARLAALRRFLHEAGPWNEERPFAYDPADPSGQNLRAKLLPVYLETRLGNCVSMPALFLILAEKLGVELWLATAPLHIFLRYRNEAGGMLNIEASSGGHPVRGEWIRAQMPMPDRAIASGLYLRGLGRAEGMALMASVVLEHLLMEERWAAAAAVAAVMLRHNPRDGYALVKRGTAYSGMIRDEFELKYSMPSLIPPPLRPRCMSLMQASQSCFAAAEALGWEPAE